MLKEIGTLVTPLGQPSQPMLRGAGQKLASQTLGHLPSFARSAVMVRQFGLEVPPDLSVVGVANTSHLFPSAGRGAACIPRSAVEPPSREKKRGRRRGRRLESEDCPSLRRERSSREKIWAGRYTPRSRRSVESPGKEEKGGRPTCGTGRPGEVPAANRWEGGRWSRSIA